MATKIAKEKVWRTHDNKLVKDGHPEAHTLVARKGATISENDLDGFKNVGDFFVDPNSKAAENAVKPEPSHVTPEGPSPVIAEAAPAVQAPIPAGKKAKAKTTVTVKHK